MARCRVGRTISRTLTALVVAALAVAAPAGAQVGLESKVSEVALLVRVAPQASIEGVGTAVRTEGSVAEASVKVRLSANTGYRLMAVGLPSGRGSRVWVRSATGEFQEIVAGASVTVARESRARGQLEHEVSYRIDSAAGSKEVEPLPVRYEVVITPAI